MSGRSHSSDCLARAGRKPTAENASDGARYALPALGWAALSRTVCFVGARHCRARAFLLVLATCAVAAPPAAGSLPGANGRLGFVRVVDEFSGLITVNPTGRRARHLIGGVGYEEWLGAPRFSPTGRVLAAHLPGPREGIWAVDARTGRRLRRLKAGREVDAEGWSPDGRRLLYSRWTRRDRSNSKLYIARTNGRAARRLTAGQGGDWSVRQRIAFARCSSSACSIHVIRPDGRGERPLTGGAHHDRDPSWSPDGRRIVFQRITYRSGHEIPEDPQESGIYVVNADGTGLRPLHQSRCLRDPVWSPDGRRIAFVNDYCTDQRDDLVVMAADGSDVRRVQEFSFRPEDDVFFSCLCGLDWSVRPQEVRLTG